MRSPWAVTEQPLNSKEGVDSNYNWMWWFVGAVFTGVSLPRCEAEATDCGTTRICLPPFLSLSEPRVVLLVCVFVGMCFWASAWASSRSEAWSTSFMCECTGMSCQRQNTLTHKVQPSEDEVERRMRRSLKWKTSVRFINKGKDKKSSKACGMETQPRDSFRDVVMVRQGQW